jgi:hypothetical protein
MRRLIWLLGMFYAGSAVAQPRELTFDDGTTVSVNYTDFTYENFRKASLGGTIMIDGLADLKILHGSYLNPEKFLITGSLGFAGLSADATIFFSGRTKEKNKSFSLKYEPAGYRTIKAYVLKAQVEKRKEWGAYIGIGEYGHLFNTVKKSEISGSEVNSDFANIGYNRLTMVYAGISSVNYWHADINIDDDQQRRGQFMGRAVLAPFVALGAGSSDTSIKKSQLPAYGARLMYELSNTFTLLGKKRIRGRTNMVLRMGADYYMRKEVPEYKSKSGFAPIFGLGWTYNFL